MGAHPYFSVAEVRRSSPVARASLGSVPTVPTAPVAAGSLIAGYAVAAGTGSRPLGGVVLLAGGLWCARAWARRNDTRTAVQLTGAGLSAFVLSHVLALGVGAWPAVLIVSAAMGALAWTQADARSTARGAALEESLPDPMSS
jgi:hypothetical protein